MQEARNLYRAIHSICDESCCTKGHDEEYHSFRNNERWVFESIEGGNNEFSVTPDENILRGSRIFIPQKLLNQALELGHESHQGIDKTKARMREKIAYLVK